MSNRMHSGSGDAIGLDRRHVWHPFTPLDGWLDPGYEPVMIASGQGTVLTDTAGRDYLDGNSSIWTNLHGHRHPKLTQALKDQLDRIAHSSYLGLAHGPGARLAGELCRRAEDRFSIFPAERGAGTDHLHLPEGRLSWRYGGSDERGAERGLPRHLPAVAFPHGGGDESRLLSLPP